MRPYRQSELRDGPSCELQSTLPGVAVSAANSLQSITRRLASASNRWANPVIVRGLEKHSQEPLTILYFGTGTHLEYLLGLTLAANPAREEYPRTKAWRSATSIKEHGKEVDLVLLDLPWPYHRWVSRGQFLESPSWLQQRLVLKNTWEEVVKSFRKNTRGGQLRKIRKYELEYRISSDSEAARTFYDDFYSSHLSARFGEAATLMPRSYVESCITRGALLQVLSRQEVLGAVVLYPWGECLQLVFAGLNGDLHAPRYKYVFPALYYFSIRFGFEQGFRELDMTGSRPLLNDGLLRFKRQWGASLHDGWNWGLDTLLIRPNNFGRAVRSVLRNNSWIVRGDRGLVGKVLLADGGATGAQVAHLARSFSCEGLQEIEFFSPSGFSQDVRELAPTLATSVRLIDLEGRKNAADLYCRS